MYSYIFFVTIKIVLAIVSCHYKINPKKTASTFRGHRVNIDETRFGETLFVREAAKLRRKETIDKR